MAFQREDFYQQNISFAHTEIKGLSRKIDRLALMRLGLIVLGGIFLFQVVQSQEVMITLLSFIALLILFFLLVSMQSKLNKKKETVERFLKINENELAVQERSTRNMYSSGEEFADDNHLYASDLDIFGEGSLFQLINRSATVGGRMKLSEWLNSPATKTHIEERQELVKELSQDFFFWQKIQAQLYFTLENPVNYKLKLESYLSRPVTLGKGRLLSVYVKVAPYLMLASLISSMFHSIGLGVFIILGIAHFLLALFFSAEVTRIGQQVSKAGDALHSFASVFEQIEQKQWKSILARRLLERIQQASKTPVSTSIKELSGLLNKLDLRYNMFLGTLVNVFMLWDLKQIIAIESWRKSQAEGIPQAFDLLSEIEAVGSIATLSFNRSSWVFPLLNDQEKHVLICTDIAHPFIGDDEVVRNSYSLSDHRLALVTGSNMAGKSTFLRTVGVNAVLAYAGAPVSAVYMEISVMRLATYMRIRDSLNESTSTFKAELDRIKMVLQEVESNTNTLFLLDEMLRGTNSVDKYLGSKAIIEKLISFRGVGMVATHDLKLADLSEVHSGYVKNFHFDIQVDGEDMLFDYLLKDGPCTIFNASLLLKKIGIEI